MEFLSLTRNKEEKHRVGVTMTHSIQDRKKPSKNEIKPLFCLNCCSTNNTHQIATESDAYIRPYIQHNYYLLLLVVSVPMPQRETSSVVTGYKRGIHIANAAG